MQVRRIGSEQLQIFRAELRQEGRSPGTVEKYLRDVCAFSAWLKGREAGRETAVLWKEALLERGLAPATINSMLAALNKFSAVFGWIECRVKPLRIQRRMFRDASRELTRQEYIRLLDTARTLGRERLELLLETICATGIRVSEVRYITVEAACRGRTEISLKGKIRMILLPSKLCRKLLKYAKKKRIASGEIFLTRGGRSLSRKQVWTEMKAICGRAGVAAKKVFPHNLRHLFARTFYRETKNLIHLADILGHNSLEVTKIYTTDSIEEWRKNMEKIKLLDSTT